MRSYGFELTQKPARPQATAAQQTLTQNLTQQVDSLKDALADLNWLAQNAEEHRNLSVQLDARQLDSRSLDVLLRDFERAQALTLKGDRIQFASEAMRDFVKGGWLELHVIQAVHEVTGSLNIRDKAMGLEVQDQATQTRNELDIAFMARNRLFVIECKTARIDKPQGNSDRAAPPKANDTLFKLAENCRRIGGYGTSPVSAANRWPAICSKPCAPWPTACACNSCASKPSPKTTSASPAPAACWARPGANATTPPTKKASPQTCQSSIRSSAGVRTARFGKRSSARRKSRVLCVTMAWADAATASSRTWLSASSEPFHSGFEARTRDQLPKSG